MDIVYKERIGPLDEHHKFLKDNEYIHKGYRLHFNTIEKILKSMFMVHNETINIWTHIIGFFLFISLLCIFIFTTDYSTNAIYYKEYLTSLHAEFKSTQSAIHESLSQLLTNFQKSSVFLEFEKNITSTFAEVFLKLQENETKFNLPLQDVQRWPILVFILSAITCLGCSSIFHLFSAHSKDVKSFMNRLDYAGISILICGSYFPPIYYFFYCHSSLVWLYLSVISIGCGLVFVVTFWKDFQKPQFRWLRGILFLILGLFGVVPIGHGMFL